MPDSPASFAELLRQDRRYRFEAYDFVFDALTYAHDVLGLGAERESEPGDEPGERASGPERHLTGQELCEAIRLFALEQFGYMAKTVLNSWGVRTTGDFGEIVFNLIRLGKMKKTPADRREDFDDVFDFETGLSQQFQIKLPE